MILNQFIKKTLLIAVIGCLGAIAMPTEAEAHRYVGDFSVNGVMYTGGINAIHLWGDWYLINDWYGWNHKTGKFESHGGGIGKVKFYPPMKTLGEEAIENDFRFSLSPGDNLQVMSSVDACCDVYEMETGKLLLQDFSIIGSNSLQSVPITPTNVPCIIVFKVDGQAVHAQHFIFNNSNNLSIGGTNNE